MLELETENYYDFKKKNHKIVCNTYNLVTPHFSSAYHLNFYAWVGLISCIIHNFFFEFSKKENSSYLENSKLNRKYLVS